MKEIKLYSPHWHLLTGEQIIEMFDSNLPEVSIQPNMLIVEQLKGLEVATLQLIEDRTFGTVYQIDRTGIVYYIDSEAGETTEFNDLEDYYNYRKYDKLIKRYVEKPVVFTLEEINGKQILKRHKYPRFEAEYQPKSMENLINIKWIDTPNPFDVAKIMRKAGAFIKNI